MIGKLAKSWHFWSVGRIFNGAQNIFDQQFEHVKHSSCNDDTNFTFNRFFTTIRLANAILNNLSDKTLENRWRRFVFVLWFYVEIDCFGFRDSLEEIMPIKIVFMIAGRSSWFRPGLNQTHFTKTSFLFTKYYLKLIAKKVKKLSSHANQTY